MEVSGQFRSSVALLPVEKAPSPHWIGGWVGPRVVLDMENILKCNFMFTDGRMSSGSFVRINIFTFPSVKLTCGQPAGCGLLIALRSLFKT